MGGAGSPSRPSWETFSGALARTWGITERGHFSIFAPQGGGKTVIATRGLVPLRRGIANPGSRKPHRLLIVDVKGGDRNLEGVGRTVARMPGAGVNREILDAGDDHDPTEPIHLRPNPDNARAAVVEALQHVWQEGGWTVYVDEVRLVSDYLGLRNMLDRLWLFARSRGVAVVTGTQAPRFVPQAMYDQADHFLIGRVRDQRILRRLAEIVSDVDDADDVLRGLADHEFLYTGPAGLAIVRYPLR